MADLSAWERWRAEEAERKRAERAERRRVARVRAGAPEVSAKAAVLEAEKVARRWERLLGSVEHGPAYRAVVARGKAEAERRRKNRRGSD